MQVDEQVGQNDHDHDNYAVNNHHVPVESISEYRDIDAPN